MALGKLVLLCGLLVAGQLGVALSLAQSCLTVPSSTADTSASGIAFIKASTAVEDLCPGMTYSVALHFGNPRTYKLVSSKGAFKDSETNCVNRVTRTVSATVGNEKLYLGCAATGSLQVTLLSTPGSGTHFSKTVSKPIKTLAQCPASPCNSQNTTTNRNSSSSTGSTSPDNTVIALTGNPITDLETVWGILTTNIPIFRIPTTLDAATAFQLITIMQGLKSAPLTPASMLSAVQQLFELVPSETDPTGMVGGMKTFLSVMAPHINATSSSSTMASSALSDLLGASTGATGSSGSAVSVLSNLVSFANFLPGAIGSSGSSATNVSSAQAALGALNNLASLAGLSAVTRSTASTPSGTTTGNAALDTLFSMTGMAAPGSSTASSTTATTGSASNSTATGPAGVTGASAASFTTGSSAMLDALSSLANMASGSTAPSSSSSSSTGSAGASTSSPGTADLL